MVVPNGRGPRPRARFFVGAKDGRATLAAIGAFAALLALVALLYWPTLRGSFLFDDFVNLNGLAVLDLPLTWAQIGAYLHNGHSGPTGRPLALLSFLLDAQSWPTDPEPFKRNNLLIHLLNVSLALWLLLCLLRVAAPVGRGGQKAVDVGVQGAGSGVRQPVGDTVGIGRDGLPGVPAEEGSRAVISLLAVACWALNPYLVSTVAYPVQRMTLLAATFTLITLVAYLKLRGRLIETTGMPGAARVGFATLLAVVAGGTLLATLAKESGALTPLFILLLEGALLQRAAPLRHPLYHRLLLPLLVLAVLAVLGFLLQEGWRYWSVGPPNRDFNAAERLLTEARLLWQYLADLLVPGTGYAGLLGAPVTVSRGILDPWTTLPALLALAGAVALAWRWRRQQPWVFLALLFFLTGHLLESTTVMLELYFEHRNYLPALLLWLPLALWLWHTTQGPRSRRLLGWGIAVVYLFWQVSSLDALSRLWGDEKALKLHWAQVNTGSVRALSGAALTLVENREPRQAIAVARRALAIPAPEPNGLLLNLYVDCRLGVRPNQFNAEFYAELRRRLAATRYSLETLHYLENLYQQASHTGCAQIDAPHLLTLLDAFGGSRGAEPGTRSGPILHLRGQILLAQGEADQALAAFRQSFARWRHMDRAMTAVALLANQGHFRHSRTLLDEIAACYRESACRTSLTVLTDYAEDIEHLDALLEEDLRRATD